MKNQKREGGVGLNEWLSYQARTRDVVQPATDVIDWDEGIEVQEEWLPREQCEQRLREESERKNAPVISSVPETPAETPVIVEAAEVAIEITPIVAEVTAAPAEVTPPVAEMPVRPVDTKEPVARESTVREIRPRPAPAQFEAADLVSAVPAFGR